MNKKLMQQDSKFRFAEPYNFTLSPYSGWTRKHWEELFYKLMKGIVDSASVDGARQRIPGPRSHHGLLADEMEGFSRSFIMVGPWLHTSGSESFTYRGETINVAEFYRKGILAGTNPGHPEYWGDIVDLAQHLVECASVSWSLFLSKERIWDTFSDAEKKQVADYLFQCTKVKYHQNNWLLFNVITNAVLKKLGMPYSQEQIDANIDACEHMYIGSGWYRDGKINRIDYYNAWGFLYYYLMWVILDGDSKPQIAAKHKERAKEFVDSFRYFFAADGSTPCFGRSMIYRFGYLSPVVLAQYMGILDTNPGEIRTMCNMGTKFFFDNGVTTDKGHLSLGYLRPNARMLEHYSCGGSPYWAVKAFNILLIPESDPFWQTQENALPIHTGNYSVAVKDAGLLVLGDASTGHVQLINQKSYHNESSYNDKYTNFAYSSIFSYEAGEVYHSFNCDTSLQWSLDNTLFFQRWKLENLYTEKDFAASKYALFSVDEEGAGHTSILVKNGLLINFHQIETKKSLYFREGGYPLGFDDGDALTASSETSEAAYKDAKVSYIRNLHGYTQKCKADSFCGQMAGTNVRNRQSVLPTLRYENGSNTKSYLLNAVYANVCSDSIEQLDTIISFSKVEDNTATICFNDGEMAFMQIGDIANVTVTLNGVELCGEIVCARIAKDGATNFVLYADSACEGDTVEEIRQIDALVLV